MGAVFSVQMRRILNKTVERRQYVSTFCNVLLFLLAYIGIPAAAYIMAFYSGGFWIHENHFRTIPTTQLQHALLNVQHHGKVCGWASAKDVQGMFGESFTYPRWETFGEDTDGDNRIDAHHVSFSLAECEGVQLPNAESPTTIEVMLFFSYSIDHHIKVSMEGAVMFHVELPPNQGNHRRVVTEGTMDWMQKVPLIKSDWIHYTRTYNYSMLNPEGVQTPSDLMVKNMYAKYSRRNESISFNAHSVFFTEPRYTDAIVELQIRLNVLPTSIVYIPGVGENLKFGYIQWFIFAYTLWFFFLRLIGSLTHLGFIQVVYSDCQELDRFEENLMPS